MTKDPQFITTYWEYWTYDVWGNRQEGYEVNNRFCQDRCVKLVIRPKLYKWAGGEKWIYSVSDRQIARVFGVRSSRIETDGDDVNIYVNTTGGYPLGELICVSHTSISHDGTDPSFDLEYQQNIRY